MYGRTHPQPLRLDRAEDGGAGEGREEGEDTSRHPKGSRYRQDQHSLAGQARARQWGQGRGGKQRTDGQRGQAGGEYHTLRGTSAHHLHRKKTGGDTGRRQGGRCRVRRSPASTGQTEGYQKEIHRRCGGAETLPPEPEEAMDLGQSENLDACWLAAADTDSCKDRNRCSFHYLSCMPLTTYFGISILCPSMVIVCSGSISSF
mmetsp:Transcript_34298/g.79298  ORF Transcript_34298/g.79298 Transcript_34298/m.79298 type:complete len:203 (+) Transcript_34298:1954-2562(+)